MEHFNHYFLETIKNRYASFRGRATRSEYWYFVLYYFIVSTVAVLLDTYLINPALYMTPEQASEGGFLQFIMTLALFVPFLSLAVRRLHDIGKSGWWTLLGLIPIVGFLILIYFYVKDSEAEPNTYG